MSEKAKILVIDDEHSVRWAFEKALQKANYEVALADNGLKGLNLYYEFKPDITFVDIRMPEMDGLQILEKVMADDPNALIIVMTAYSDMETTVNAMKLGAYDFLTKPFNIDECLSLISRGLTARNSNKVAELGVQAPKSSALKGNSAAMQEVYKLIGKVSGEDVSVLVCGESGCGKELVAQAIHFNSRRSSKPFWPINCTAISESLMESEFFGYEKGAFTGAATSKQGMFELAQGGTIFLDEIGDMFVLTTSLSAASPWQLMVKRIADIFGGLIGCLITGIAYLFVAPQIKKIDPGPVFFHQTRIGRNGRRFELYKFRSMYQDAEARKAELMDLNEMEGPMFKIKDDPRILPKIGKRIRDWSIDELPQFWNILKGDMSLVGTRPPTVEEFECYEPHHKARLSFRPGLTGLWQVSGRNRIDEFEEIVRLDTEYIKNWSLREDLMIILKTFVVVLKRKGSM